jgi:phosphate:Na+ symporter
VAIGFQISVIYLALQIAGAVMVTLFQSKIIPLLNKLYPEKEEESLGKPKFIYAEAIEDPDIVISLVKKEQERIISTLSKYLEPLRTDEIEHMPVSIRHEANLQLANEIKQFIDEISHHELGKEMSDVLQLQSYNESIIALLESLNNFTNTVGATKNFKEGLSGSMIESLHLVLTLMEETLSGDENTDFLMELTSDKGQLMDNIRNTLLSETSIDINIRKSLFVSTRVFERILWQIRQMLNVKTQNE